MPICTPSTCFSHWQSRHWKLREKTAEEDFDVKMHYVFTIFKKSKLVDILAVTLELNTDLVWGNETQSYFMCAKMWIILTNEN